MFLFFAINRFHNLWSFVVYYPKTSYDNWSTERQGLGSCDVHFIWCVGQTVLGGEEGRDILLVIHFGVFSCPLHYFTFGWRWAPTWNIMDRGTLISPIIIFLNFLSGYWLWGPVIAISLIYFLMANILVFLFFSIVDAIYLWSYIIPQNILDINWSTERLGLGSCDVHLIILLLNEDHGKIEISWIEAL